jgi:serine/threonine protein kinase
MRKLSVGQIMAGRYEVLERLGCGGMADIHLARDLERPDHDPPVVLKRILPHLAEREDFVRMFLDEARIASRLDHPNIAHVHDLIQDGPIPLQVVEFVQGVSLLDWMTLTIGEPVDIGLILEALGQVCVGLDYAHRLADHDGSPLNIIHRDISPQNLLIDVSGMVKLIDFGVAKAAIRTDRTQAGVLKGKYPYMAPERIKGQAEDHRSDLFSLGVVGYELTTRHRLFWRSSDFQTLSAIVKEDVPPLRKVWREAPPAFEEWLARALARDPNVRFQSAGEMADGLLRIAHDLGLEGERPRLGQLARRLQELVTGKRMADAEEGADTVAKALTMPELSAYFEEGTATSRADPKPFFDDNTPTALDDVTPAAFEPEPPPPEVPLARMVADDPCEPSLRPAAASGPEARRQELREWTARTQEATTQRPPAQRPPAQRPSLPAGEAQPQTCDESKGAISHIPQLSEIPDLGRRRTSTLFDCLSYALAVIRMRRARRAAIEALSWEVERLERERGELLIRLGKRLRDVASGIDPSISSKLDAFDRAEGRPPESPQTPLARELADIEARLPDLTDDVDKARQLGGEPLEAAEAMMYFARVRVAEINAALGQERQNPTPPPQIDPKIRERREKLLADLGRVAWHHRAFAERANDLYHPLDRCGRLLELCRARSLEEERAQGEFERRPVAVAFLCLLIPALSVAVLITLFALRATS